MSHRCHEGFEQQLFLRTSRHSCWTGSSWYLLGSDSPSPRATKKIKNNNNPDHSLEHQHLCHLVLLQAVIWFQWFQSEISFPPLVKVVWQKVLQPETGTLVHVVQAGQHALEGHTDDNFFFNTFSANVLETGSKSILCCVVTTTIGDKK